MATTKIHLTESELKELVQDTINEMVDEGIIGKALRWAGSKLGICKSQSEIDAEQKKEKQEQEKQAQQQAMQSQAQSANGPTGKPGLFVSENQINEAVDTVLRKYIK